MKFSAMAIAAAMTLGVIGAAPAAAQPGHERVVKRTVVVHQTSTNNRRHNGWNNGRHNGWNKNRRQVCRVTYRHHRKVRTCTTRRW